MDKRVFDTMKNGYNRYQVDDYLQTQKLLLDSLQKKLDKEVRINEDLTKELDELKKNYEEVNHNLQVKEMAASEMTRMAMKEANMIVDTANQNADAIIKEALMMARGILLDVSRIGNEASDMKENMQDELQRIVEALNRFETPIIPDLDLLKKEF